MAVAARRDIHGRERAEGAGPDPRGRASEEGEVREETLSAADTPNIPALMAEIRARLAARIEGRDARQPFQSSATDGEGKFSRKPSDIVHSEELRYLNRHYAYSAQLNLDGISSHRGGFLGKLIVKVKRKAVRILWDSLLRDYFAAEREYQANLVRFLNDMSSHVGARGSAMFWELVRKIDVDVGKALERIDRISDEHHAELRTTERRLHDALQNNLGELRTWLGEVHTLAASQEARVTTLDSVARGLEGIVATRTRASTPPSAEPPPPTTIEDPDPSYLLLENRYRGSEDLIRERLSIYPPFFEIEHSKVNAGENPAPVLEIGAGRGELQALFRERGITSYGIDIDPAMVRTAQEKGCEVRLEDGIAHLQALPDSSLSGVIAIQVVEHLTRGQIKELIAQCRRVVRPGGRVVFETINPRSLLALSSNYFRDPTHVWPLHPDTLGYALTLGDLHLVETMMLSPVPEEAKLKLLSAEEYMTPRWSAMIDRLNGNLSALNDLLYGYQDYCVIAEVPAR